MRVTVSDKKIEDLNIGDAVISAIGSIGLIYDVTNKTIHPDCPYDPIDNDYLIKIIWVGGNESIQSHMALDSVIFIGDQESLIRYIREKK